MQPSLFRYIWQHTRRDQIWIIAVILLSLPFLFMSLDLPKLIVHFKRKVYEEVVAAFRHLAG